MILQAGGEDVLGAWPLAWLAAALLGLCALGVLASAVLQPGRRRLYVAVGALPAAALAIGQVAAATDLLAGVAGDGAAVDAARLAAYLVVLPVVGALVGRVAGQRRWLIALLGAIAFGHVATLAGWLLVDGQAGLVSLVVALVLAGAGAYGLLAAVSSGAPRPRRLLAVRLAGLVAVAWPLVALGVGLGPGAAGLLDPGTATLLGGYLDVAVGLSVGALCARGGRAIDYLTGEGAPADGTVAAPPVDDERGVDRSVEDEATGEQGPAAGDA